MKIALIVSRFNEEITAGLLGGAQEALAAAGLRDDDVATFHVPGAFEIPLAAMHAAESGAFDAVVCLGCVIKGETMHFEYIADAVANGIMRVGLNTGVPVVFGVLTTVTEEQAGERSQRGAGNKGAEAARAAVDMARLLPQLKAQERP